ncbi:anhydro-N-acetylmuramic acid kinase [Deinococcus hopiensis]|uniref:Anhydro-N-acetylmuramic acid kinase n=1 Tax=Deinococcus hopiensis KR-140 TaxID=695939 RepID=A0A1W1UFN8_9DEIO|nr:anhydro-N-acetylmuramic acid kinase [Deinococcus hopiensis]SMB79843.1 anhydro-N-acetylmuramic acid kinase [Deinococcus hopiensis KR-140]
MSPRVLGLMSGTSADGIDAALLELPGWPDLGRADRFPELPAGVPRGRVLDHSFTPFAPDLRAAVLAATRSSLRVAELTQLHAWLGEALAAAAAPLAASADLIASHGQTVQHHPRPDPARGWTRPATLQLGEAALIAQQSGKPVVADFRPADLAAGGVGAPLVPFADWALLGEQGVRRAVHNLGGISNLTYLPGTAGTDVLAFDTGPGNCLLDEAAAQLGQTCDEDGRLAASGQVHAETLAAWLAHPELQQPPPKATGREVWTLDRLPRPAPLSVPDLAATATAFTARTVADAYRRWVVPRGLDEVVVGGGGARNPTLMKALGAALAPLPVRTFADVGWAAYGFTDATREAAAFAFLGYARAQGWTNTLPQATGARHAVSAGHLLFPPPGGAQ